MLVCLRWDLQPEHFGQTCDRLLQAVSAKPSYPWIQSKNIDCIRPIIIKIEKEVLTLALTMFASPLSLDQ